MPLLNRTTDDVFWDPGEQAPVRDAPEASRHPNVVLADRLEPVIESCGAFEKTRVEMAKRYKPVDAKRYLLDPSYGMTAKRTGDQKLKDLCDAITRLNKMSVKEFGHPIPSTHLRIMQIIISSLLEKIYGDEFEARKPHLLKVFGVSFFRTCSFVSMFRRSGKSELVAMLIAAYAVTQPTSKTCIYSVGKRASASLANKIVNYILKLMGKDMKFIVKNDERILFTNQTGGVAEICSYPANEEVCLFFFYFFFFLLVAGSKRYVSSRKVSFTRPFPFVCCIP